MKNKKKTKTGNNIQIEWERYVDNEHYVMQYLILNVVALDFQSAVDDEWRGTYKGAGVWVKFTKNGHDTIFSDNFPTEHKDAASDEVRRILRQFN